MASEPQNLKKIKDWGRPEFAVSLARVPGSSRLFYGSSDGNIYHVDVAAEKPEFQPLAGHTSYVTGLAIAGNQLVSGSYDCRLMWWNTETREKVRTVENAHQKWIRKLAAPPDGRFVISVADDMLVKVWKGDSGELVHTLQDHALQTPNHYPSMLYTCAVSADGKKVATADKVGHVVVWDIEAGKKLGAVEAPGLYTWDPAQRRHSIGGARSVAFSPDGTLLAVGGIGKIGNIDHLDGPTRLEIFDWQKAEKKFEIQDDKLKGLIEQLVFDPTGKWLLGTGGDHNGFINFYNLTDGKIVKQEKAGSHIYACALDEAAEVLYLASHNQISHWELKA